MLRMRTAFMENRVRLGAMVAEDLLHRVKGLGAFKGSLIGDG